MSRGPRPGTFDLNDSKPDDFPNTEAAPFPLSLGGLGEKLPSLIFL